MKENRKLVQETVLIRTYNYPQNRVTDHRIGLTIQQLDRIIEGKLDDIITALINEDQRLKLEGQK